MKRKITVILIILSVSIIQAFTQVDTTRIYRLGEVIIEASAEKTDTANNLSISTIDKMNLITISDALDRLPGIVQNTVGSRNESVVYIRGFELRQLPLFIDGIPVYVPFDGYVDLNRFTTFDLSQIQVSKGGSSVLYGANTMGGAINLVTQKPKKDLEMNGVIGRLSGGQRANINVGSRFKKFYTQLGLSHFHRDYFSLAHDFTDTLREDGGNRENSYNTDNKFSFKMGYAPNDRNEYSIVYTRQHGEKGTPVYTGQDTLNSQFFKPRYWQWPFWNKENAYFISKTALSSKTYIKTRLFYDAFNNELNSYDDDTYTTQTRPYAFTSIFDDYSLGGSLETGTNRYKNHYIKLAAHYKNDVHRQYDQEKPKLTMSDNTTSFGVEDAIKIAEKLRINVGMNWNTRSSIQADNLVNDAIEPFPNNFSQAINGQLYLTYAIDSLKSRLFTTVARKSRFATLKDRYSYRTGSAIPNPELKPEDSWNFELGTESIILSKIIFRPVLFYSYINDVIQLIDNVYFDTLSGYWLAQQQNAGKAEFYGVEALISYQISKKMKVSTNYTFIKRKNLSNSDILFINVPEHNWSGFVEYHFTENIWGMGVLEYNSDRYSTTYGTIANEFALINFKAHSKIWKYLALEAGVNNLLDKNYAYEEGYPEQGRNYYVSFVLNY